jgi:hypothetical protein
MEMFLNDVKVYPCLERGVQVSHQFHHNPKFHNPNKKKKKKKGVVILFDED